MSKTQIKRLADKFHKNKDISSDRFKFCEYKSIVDIPFSLYLLNQVIKLQIGLFVHSSLNRTLPSSYHDIYVYNNKFIFIPHRGLVS